MIPLIATVAIVLTLSDRNQKPPSWSLEELDTIKSLWLSTLPPLPSDTTNRVADDLNAAALGHRLFFDTRLSKNGRVACATCHQPNRLFTDGIALAEGMKVGKRNTMSVVGTAYSPWFFWDGRKDSQWAQALGPLESDAEHAGNRFQFALLLSLDPEYRRLYEILFDDFPDVSDEESVNRIFANMGKSIAAYQRLLLPGISRFDNYVDHLINQTEFPIEQSLTLDEKVGLKIFIDEGQCINCHNGPLFTNFSFHNTGIFPRSGETPDLGRVSGVNLVREDTFNCLGQFSDDSQHCDELTYMKEDDDNIGAQKTPSLRTLIGTEPYMHAGQLQTLTDVLNHYNTADGAIVGHNEAKPLNLNQRQLKQLEAFLKSLEAPINADPQWLKAPEGMEEGEFTPHSGAY